MSSRRAGECSGRTVNFSLLGFVLRAVSCWHATRGARVRQYFHTRAIGAESMAWSYGTAVSLTVCGAKQGHLFPLSPLHLMRVTPTGVLFSAVHDVAIRVPPLQTRVYWARPLCTCSSWGGCSSGRSARPQRYAQTGVLSFRMVTEGGWRKDEWPKIRLTDHSV